MSLWRNVRGEMAGAWRSICYDLGRRPAGRDPGPDVTSTGLNTFPGSLVDLPAGPAETDARPPQRFVAVAAFCALAACGAAGSYLVATTAFAGRMGDTTVSAAAPPESLQVEDETTGGGIAGMGRVPRTPGAQRAVPAPPAPTATTPGTAGVAVPPQVAAPRPPARGGHAGTGSGATTPVTVDPECDCETPPVPTPTAPPSPTAPVSVSASPAASDPPSPIASDSLSSGPDDITPSADSDRHHRRHWR